MTVLLRAHSFLLKATPLITVRRPPQSRLARTSTRTFCNSNGMDDKNDQPEPTQSTGDAMSHSFGEAYSTRAEEEGFDGIYHYNRQTLEKVPDDDVHEHGKTQGSEVNGKEKGQNQAKD